MGLVSPLTSAGTPVPLQWSLPGQAKVKISLTDFGAGLGLRVTLWPIGAFKYAQDAIIAGRQTQNDTLNIEEFDQIFVSAKKDERRIRYYVQPLGNQAMKFEMEFFFANSGSGVSRYEFDVQPNDRLYGSIPVII